jgi:two-component system, LuxR family, sensor histidine kinase DctS
MSAHPPAVTAGTVTRWLRARALLWTALVVLLLAALSLLVALTFHYRSSRMQAAVEANAATAADQLVQLLERNLQAILALPGRATPSETWQHHAQELLLAHPEVLRLERRSADHRVLDAVDTRSRPPLFSELNRSEAQLDTELACSTAHRRHGPTYSRSYFVPHSDGLGQEVMDVCIEELLGDQPAGFVTATYSLAGLLDRLSVEGTAPGHELSLIEGDGSRLAHGRMHVGAGVYRAGRIVDVPDAGMQLWLDSASTRPSLVPDLVTALVVGLSLTLLGVVTLLARDVRKRTRVEGALAEALAFRKAMEDSVVTGLRARDLNGHITYVNPAFCEMVGFSAAELIDRVPPPYWPPEHLEAYERRQQIRLASTPSPQSREGFETVFMRRNGERFPVMILESPLVDGAGTQTGWMSAVLDLSAQRRAEELSRQQQERMQATARLATVGEMASLLSHELNQPLAAIAAYATGSLNMMDRHAPGAAPDAEVWPELQTATQRIADQADRAGRVIKSVHDFVRRREHAREVVGVDALFESVLPLIRLQARKSGTRIEVDVETPAPRVLCDRAMVEQVLLNLTRNGIQAMQLETTVDPLLTLRVREIQPQWIVLSVIDQGPGIADDIARQMFNPFFTTRSDGMGLGLSVCRTIVEQHGGALDFENRRDERGQVVGAEFRFTLPAAAPRRAHDTGADRADSTGRLISV